MKYALTISILLNLVLGGILYLNRSHVPREDYHAIEAEQRLTQHKLDSILRVIILTHDSVQFAHDIFETLRRQNYKTELELKQAQTKLAGIKFVKFQTDSARWKELVKLYPSLK